MENLKQNLNNLCHTPWGSLISYHAWWLLVAYCYWRVAAAYLVASFLWTASQLLLGYQFNQHMHVAPSERPQLVVAISGCDSGFGRALAVRLAQDDGFIVLAGCLAPTQVRELAALQVPNLHAAPLDVTHDASVAAFAATLAALVAAGGPSEKEGSVTGSDQAGGRAGGSGSSNTPKPTSKRQLHALVKNAGVGTGGCVDWLPMDAFQRDMEVNYFGLVRLTKACLPLLKQAALAKAHAKRASWKGAKAFSYPPRIVNMTSSAGLVAAPFFASYCGSKHAAEAFSACLRMELTDWNIAVATANPTFHRTPLVASGSAVVRRVWHATAPATKAEYGEAYFEYVAEKSVAMMHENLWDPANVVDALRGAVTARKPRAQLLVGVDAKFALPLARHYPSWALEALTRLKAFPRMPTLAALANQA